MARNTLKVDDVSVKAWINDCAVTPVGRRESVVSDLAQSDMYGFAS